MGINLSKIWDKVLGKGFIRFLMLGLDFAGKTTILYKLNLGEVVGNFQLIGFNIEIIDFEGLKFIAWDLGGYRRIRTIDQEYYKNTDCFIFVVDSTDIYRIDEAAIEFKELLNEELLKECPFLVFANKQDLSGAMKPEEVAEKLELDKIKDRPWLVKGTVAITGEGIKEGFNWIADLLSKKK